MTNWIHSGTLQHQPSQRELRHRQLAREAAAEGIVLLKNENLLPITASKAVALFGNGAIKTVKGGIGSGDVNNRENINIYQGLKEAGVKITSKDWLAEYEDRYTQARLAWKDKILADVEIVDNPFDAYASNPFSFPKGRSLEVSDLEGADLAVYVISRISGEGKDRRKEKGDYYLSEQEQEDLLYLNEQRIPTVLIINAGGPVELTDILEQTDYIQAILNISQLGQEGGYAVADVLLGKTTPSGKLTATWAKRYEDYPFAEEFSYLNGNLDYEEYREGIFVGYRYFDSFDVKPLFPFGYGGSYTSFGMEYQNLAVDHSEIRLEMNIENMGDLYAGKEVVQCYVSLPQGGLPKEYHRLAGFVKTKELQPKESQIVSITIPQKQLASFSEEMQAWIVEQGVYGIWVGADSLNIKLVALLTVSEQVVLEKVKEICPVQKAFKELTVSEYAVSKEKEWIKEARDRNIPVVSFMPQEEKKYTYKSYVEETKKVEDLIPLLYGNITKGASMLGSAGVHVPGSAGETTEELMESHGIQSMIMADGPAGLRLRQSYEVDRKTDTVYGMGVLGSLDNGYLEPMEYHEDADLYYQYCTAFPVGTALAQTWNQELMRVFGEAIATEMQEFHVNLWLAPGMNIHRNPLCGRNFEYFSEDPYLSGRLAAAVTQGVQSKKGCGVTIKHFACNNQEDNRMGVDACVSQRALREIYFRGFEIAVKQSAPVALMSSYNLINGVHAANNKDMCTQLVREEWGFDGVIMSDWNTTVPEDGSIPWKCADAGNDIIMPGNTDDDQNIRNAYKEGLLSAEKIRACAGRILHMIQKLNNGISET